MSCIIYKINFKFCILGHSLFFQACLSLQPRHFIPLFLIISYNFLYWFLLRLPSLNSIPLSLCSYELCVVTHCLFPCHLSLVPSSTKELMKVCQIEEQISCQGIFDWSVNWSTILSVILWYASNFWDFRGSWKFPVHCYDPIKNCISTILPAPDKFFSDIMNSIPLFPGPINHQTPLLLSTWLIRSQQHTPHCLILWFIKTHNDKE